MPKFITTGRLTKSGVDGLMAKPEDRMPALKALTDAVDAKILSYYLTTGRNDFVMITEGADMESAVSAIMVAVHSGSISDVETVQAWTSAEFAEMANTANDIVGKYQAPGS
ncbi:GYD domain-containing protein [Ruegeria profundi]|uniref:GYD domain-containing protein n=1 Tax=Ruegeria profundi TaxID=1685378 RepID=A0A0X3U240_9RHOB|nr:GYD domain-containing protein [Ruegeria profundi]KUJ81311.1 hypothetical protein AVO44_05525 [Ruegeria profundi]